MQAYKCQQEDSAHAEEEKKGNRTERQTPPDRLSPTTHAHGRMNVRTHVVPAKIVPEAPCVHVSATTNMRATLRTRASLYAAERCLRPSFTRPLLPLCAASENPPPIDTWWSRGRRSLGASAGNRRRRASAHRGRLATSSSSSSRTAAVSLYGCSCWRTCAKRYRPSLYPTGCASSKVRASSRQLSSTWPS